MNLVQADVYHCLISSLIDFINLVEWSFFYHYLITYDYYLSPLN